MRRFILLISVCYATLSLHAQEWSREDSIRLQKLLQSEGEIKLNPEALNELQTGKSVEAPHMYEEKPWLEFNTTLPANPVAKTGNPRLTLHPYTPTTPYDWDPVLQRPIFIDRDDKSRCNLKSPVIPSNWAKEPLDAGPRETVEQIEATGLRYRFTERVNNMTIGSWQYVGNPTGLDLMVPFKKDFWKRKTRKRRMRTLEILRMYGDSITVNEGIIRPYKP